MFTPDKRRIEQWVFTTGGGGRDGEIFSLKGTRVRAEKFAKQIQKQGAPYGVRIHRFDVYGQDMFEIVGRALRGIKNGRSVIIVEWED